MGRELRREARADARDMADAVAGRRWRWREEGGGRRKRRRGRNGMEWRSGGKGPLGGGVARRRGPDSIVKYGRTGRETTRAATARSLGLLLPYPNKLSIAVSAQVAAERSHRPDYPPAPDPVSPRLRPLLNASGRALRRVQSAPSVHQTMPRPEQRRARRGAWPPPHRNWWHADAARTWRMGPCQLRPAHAAEYWC